MATPLKVSTAFLVALMVATSGPTYGQTADAISLADFPSLKTVGKAKTRLSDAFNRVGAAVFTTSMHPDTGRLAGCLYVMAGSSAERLNAILSVASRSSGIQQKNFLAMAMNFRATELHTLNLAIKDADEMLALQTSPQFGQGLAELRTAIIATRDLWEKVPTFESVVDAKP